MYRTTDELKGGIIVNKAFSLYILQVIIISLMYSWTTGEFKGGIIVNKDLIIHCSNVS